MAHEVKNPLNAILLHVEVAKAKLARGETDIEPQMEIISREILRLDRVVKTFLDFTRPVELKLTTVPLQELMGEIVELARPQAEASKIAIVVQQDAEGVEVRVDRDLLKQAVLNVVVNAMQAMPEGGELRFEALANEDTAEIRISDTGAGIPPELREKIFRLYFTTRKEGSGIGLAMTFRIVQLHDGTIDFTSEPGKGTTFVIRLPIAVVIEAIRMKRVEAMLVAGLAISLSGCVSRAEAEGRQGRAAAAKPAAAPAPAPLPQPLSIPQTNVQLPPAQPVTPGSAGHDRAA